MATAAHVPVKPTIPGPRGRLVFGSLPDARRDPLSFYLDARARYGDVVRFRSLGSWSWIFLAHPEDVDHVLRANYKNYPKGIFETQLKLLVGEGLLTSEGSFWLRQRRLAQPAFHRKRLEGLAATIAAAAEAVVDRWRAAARAGEPFDVSAEMMRLTLQIVSRALFSADVSEQAAAIRQALTVALAHVDFRMMHLFAFPEWVPTPRNLRFRKAMPVLDKVVLDLIANRRASGQDTGDLLSMLLLARDEETGVGMTDAQLRDEVMTILLAGHETTAVALSWAWYLLAQHAAAEARLHAELDHVLGGRRPGVEDLGRLPYTKMVIAETLRLYPPAWGIGRQAKESDEIRGYAIPAGTPVAMSQYVTHRHPDFWERPEEFDPERFTPERAESRPPFAYFPFGGGPRQCIGNNFALMEAQLILATLAQHYRVRLVPGQTIVPRPMITLRPKYGVYVNLDERAG